MTTPTLKHYAFEIGHTKSNGEDEHLDGGFLDARDQQHAEWLVKRMISGHRAWPSLCWWYSLSEEAV